MKAFSCIAMALLAAANAFAKMNVVATTADFGAIAQQIGGEQVDVFTITRPSEDPHFVDAKPNLMVKLNRADVLIEGGAELEAGWLPTLVDQSRNSKITPGKPGRIAGLEGVQLVEVPTALDRSKGDVHGAGNPHYTTDPINMKIVAEHIAKAFAQLEPKSAALFQANAQKLTAEIDAHMEKWQSDLAPLKGKRIVSYHNAWPYFGNRFGVRIDLFLEPKPGIPPSPAHLASVVGTMKNENVRVIIVEPYRDRKYAETVAKHTGAAIVDVMPYPGAKGAGETYVAWMDRLVKSLAAAFNSKP